MDSIEAHPLFSYQETVEELRTNLWSANWELEELRNNVRDEMKKKDEEIARLIHLLNTANRERDEVKENLRVLLRYLQQTTPVDFAPVAAPFPQACCSSSYTNSDGHNNATTSAGLSKPHIDIGCSYDPIESKLNQLIRMPLPERGNLLQPVLDAGPLLRTLMVVGDLPAWRNPPHLERFGAAPMRVRSPSSVVHEDNSSHGA